jgi:hypothetical protein
VAEFCHPNGGESRLRRRDGAGDMKQTVSMPMFVRGLAARISLDFSDQMW